MANYCTACGAPIREGSRFCQRCGTPFYEPCPQCGAPVSGTKFCPECGCKLEPLIPVEESTSSIYEEIPSDSSTSISEEPVYVTPQQAERVSYDSGSSSSPFDVNEPSVSSAFSNAPVKKPFYKKWWFWLIAGIVLLGIIGSIAGSDDKVDISSNQKEETSNVLVASKPERDGFNNETNTSYEVGGIRYSIPEYFGDEKTDENMIQLYAETGNEVVMLQITSHNDVSFSSDKIYSGLDEVIDAYVDGMELYDITKEDAEKTTLAGLPANHYVIRGKNSQANDITVTVDATVGYDDETHMVHSVLLVQSENPEYSYKKDYKKIVESADKVDKSDGMSNNSGLVNSSVKEAMDSYEAFVDEYIAFMQKYETSSDASGMLMEYMNYMTKYADLTEKIENMEDQDMSDADYAYYTEVLLRCSQKMLQAAG